MQIYGLSGSVFRANQHVANGRIVNASWVETDVIDKTNGFVYTKHWRSMLCKVVGEFYACRVEAAMEAAHPADIQQLRTLLNRLWKDRCSFAHADLAANMANTQLTFNAPSLAISHYNQLRGILSRYQVVMLGELPAP